MNGLVNKSQYRKEGAALPIDSIFFTIEAPHKTVLDLTHQIAKTIEDISLDALLGENSFTVKVPETVIKHAKNLIHSLHVAYSCVKTSIYEQYAR